MLVRQLLYVFVWLCAVFAASAQIRAFGVVEAAARLRGTTGLTELRALAASRMADESLQTADDHLLTAELLKQLGDPRATVYYERAIKAAERDPVYELLYADYLRNFRGPRRPLFGEAETHYAEALRKLRAGEPREAVIADRIDRGLVALYQEDGLTLAPDDGPPSLFLTSINRLSRSTSDLDEVHDTRDFTSEALFASSAIRLGRELTPAELRSIVRIKEPVAAFARVRFRSEGMAADLSYQGRSIDRAQITSFSAPGAFNDVTLHGFGGGLEYTFPTQSGIDVYWRGGASWFSRKGVVEFQPAAKESIFQLDLRGAVSRFIGPDKLNVEAVWLNQGITLDDADDPPDHDRFIGAITAEYQILRPLPFLGNPYGHLFALRGIHLRGGAAEDLEDYGSTRVTRRDYFAGIAINGLGPVDVSVQPALIESRVSDDPRQTHSHLRTDASVVFRLLDEERQPGIPKARILGLHPAFVHLALLFKRDTARKGLDAFENDKLGAAVTVKLFRRALSPALDRVSPATLLASARYDRQRFPHLDRNERLVTVSVSLGY